MHKPIQTDAKIKISAQLLNVEKILPKIYAGINSTKR
jgi:hypothetical protein